jgi:hypothetical protein
MHRVRSPASLHVPRLRQTVEFLRRATPWQQATVDDHHVGDRPSSGAVDRTGVDRSLAAASFRATRRHASQVGVVQPFAGALAAAGALSGKDAS